MFQKIKEWVDRKKPQKIVITINPDDPYGLHEYRHLDDGSVGAINMLGYALAKELQYACHGCTDKKTRMKAILDNFHKGTLRMACDMSDHDYIYKPMWEEKEETNAEDSTDR